MSRGPKPHAATLDELAALRDEGRAVELIDGEIVHKAMKATEVFRHDLSGFRRDAHSARPRGVPVDARPDWVCEILSPSTARYDLVKKQRTLHAHGVRHYWIVDVEHATLTVMRWAESHYLRVLDAGVGDVVRAEPFEAIEIDVREIVGVEDP